MIVTQLYIGNDKVDLFKDEGMTINSSIKNIKDLDKVFTDFSRSFTIPASKQNNKIFKHYYNFNIVGGFDAKKKQSAKIELNGVPFKEGYIKLDGCELRENKAHSYKVTFFGGLGNLKDLFNDEKLEALSGLDDYLLDSGGEPAEYDSDTIKSYLQLNPSSNDVVVPLITHTKRLFYDSVGSEAANNGNLYWHGGGGTHDHGLNYDELKFAIRVHKVIEEIESVYGVTFSSDFFDSSNAPYYNLFMWLHRRSGAIDSGDQVTQNALTVTDFSLGTVVNTQIGTLVDDKTIRLDSDDILYMTDVDLVLTPNSAYSTIEYIVTIYRDGDFFYRRNIVGSFTIDDSLTTGYTEGDYTVEISSLGTSGVLFDEIKWDLEAQFPPSDDPLSTTEYSSTNFDYGNTTRFLVSKQVPEITVIDFLTGLFKMFNLIAYYNDDTNEIVVKSLDEFYSDSTTTWDITEYVDYSKSTVNVALPYRDVTFNYKDTKTFLAAKHKQKFNQEWGTEVYSDEKSISGTKYKIEPPFGHMKFERLIDLGTDNDTSIQWGYSVDESQNAYLGSPLLFYPILQSGGESIQFLDEALSGSQVTSYVVPSNSVSLSSSTSDKNINFKAEINEYSRESDFNGTLFEEYYKSYISGIFNPKNRLTKLDVHFPISFILNHSLADTIRYNNEFYRINSIKINTLDGKGTIELLNKL
jgi:hypothetical protein